MVGTSGVLESAFPSFLGCCVSDAEGAGSWSDCTSSMVVVPSVFVGGSGFFCGAVPELCEGFVSSSFPASRGGAVASPLADCRSGWALGGGVDCDEGSGEVMGLCSSSILSTSPRSD